MKNKFSVAFVFCFAFLFLGCEDTIEETITNEIDIVRQEVERVQPSSNSPRTLIFEEEKSQEFFPISDFKSSNVTMTSDANYRYFTGNGLPDHTTGTFPNRGNPNTISEQNVHYRVPKNPEKNSTPTDVQLPGIALNGIVFEPGTAERWSSDSGITLNYEAIQNTLNLGLDDNNAHVQPTGLYHYHGTPTGLINLMNTSNDIVHIGYAADGFGMYYSRSGKYKPSYQLLSGNRSEGPSGKYDGTFTQDFQYVSGSGDLDTCNGIEINGTYGYFITKEFPYISRCLYGTPDSSFNKRGGGQPGGMRHPGNRPPHPPRGGHPPRHPF